MTARDGTPERGSNGSLADAIIGYYDETWLEPALLVRTSTKTPRPS